MKVDVLGRKSFMAILSLVIFAVFGATTFAQEIDEILFAEIPMVMVASQQYEPLEETPVITNVITAEEIKRMGARTLNDVLLTIPGFSHIQDYNDYYCGARGIYGSAQQKILILRDGHKFNVRSYNEANTDYSIALDNIERIEVMRGPGSSLYGDVALTGVVNIITKTGADINGIETSIGLGNYGQKKLAIVLGRKFGLDKDVMLSGTIYENSGEKVDWVDPRYGDRGTGIIYGFRDKPAYDIHLKFKKGNTGVSFSERYSHYIEPVSTVGHPPGRIYDFDYYLRFSGESPGLSRKYDNFELTHSPKIGKSEVNSKIYLDAFEIRGNTIIDPAEKMQAFISWRERSAGIQAQLSNKYSLEGIGDGSILFGIQGETMEVYYSVLDLYMAREYRSTMEVLEKGRESSYALYSQVKHYIKKNLITNFGLRYDYKKRKERPDVSDVDQLSPRISLIYLHSDKTNFRIGYARSFVDAPYWYRYNYLPSYIGACTLKPEEMDTYQFTVEKKFLDDNSLSNRLNFFINDFTNVVFREIGGIYRNAGKVKSSGIEYEIGLNKKSVSLRANYTYQHFSESTGYALKYGMLENIPAHMANVIVDCAPLYNSNVSWGKNLWFNLSQRYIGKQYARWGKELSDPKDTVDDALITDFGVTLKNLFNDKISAGFRIHNLFNVKYYQGGSVDYPFQQAGRWGMGEISYKF